VASLKSKIAALEVAMQASEAQQKQMLEKAEGELTAKMEALNLLQSEHGKFQAELDKLQVEKEVLEKQLASGDSTIEKLEWANKELIEEKKTRDSTIEKLEEARKKLIDNMDDTFAEGFQEALA